MGVYIHDLEMPKTDALLHIHADGRAVYYPFNADDEVTEFQAIPVPPHGRLIDADALLMHLGDTEYKGAVKRVLMQAPTIIPAEEGET